ncbi:MAG TPA: hypothetical protein VKZ63_05505 [Kofleriaceae bacterium]|nr:hypothetical protein [Kofleriaceae bacterium]
MNDDGRRLSRRVPVTTAARISIGGVEIAGVITVMNLSGFYMEISGSELAGQVPVGALVRVVLPSADPRQEAMQLCGWVRSRDVYGRAGAGIALLALKGETRERWVEMYQRHRRRARATVPATPSASRRIDRSGQGSMARQGVGSSGTAPTRDW